ncbi:ATP-binding protein [Domibacillus epiphyticus]|uniref:histidine kinase n=1 Tax=Domibacillus epiphyticus TaxID=1714355 RepID=A0A1V2A7D4_9BACI|nr:ATP-binding protein [Domibacillus epiphyticus]OMP66921.1 hypothetical protein BTO28_09950 [Domibacillus epiphyticus]
MDKLLKVDNQIVGKLKDTEQLLKAITENMREILCIYTISDMQILYVSESFERIWGLKTEVVYENPEMVIETVHQKDKELFMNKMHHPGGTFDYRIVRPDKTIRWIRSSQTVISNEKNEPVRVIIVSDDITDLKEKEQMIFNADTLGAIGQLAAGIAHEIRNPMTAIKGFVQLWKQESINAYSDIILSELERVEFIMSEFLMLAKPQQSHKIEQINMRTLIEEVATFMRPEALLKNIEIKTQIDEQLPRLNVEQKQMKQVIINLMKNGIEAMLDGGILTVSVSVHSNKMFIEVIDQGIGIPEEAIPRLGEPFFSNKDKGTGLGLMVSKKMIHQHNGDLVFTSEEGKGTKARIILPVNSEK